MSFVGSIVSYYFSRRVKTYNKEADRLLIMVVAVFP